MALRLSDLTLLALSMTVALVLPAQANQIVGEARDLRSGELLYTELHRCDSGGELCSVAYVDLDGNKIAQKKIDYSRDSQAPLLTVTDYRSDRKLVVDNEAEADLVIDAGFDNFIRNNWQTLGGNGKVNFRFLVPGRAKPLPMKARQSAPEDCAANALCLEVGLDNWLLAALTDPILLTYARDTQRLLRYRGISNLASAEGKSQMVDIVYTYQEGESEQESLSGE